MSEIEALEVAVVQVKAVVAVRPGRFSDVLGITSVRRPVPLAAGEVDVRMLASTVNPSDVITVSGAYGSRTDFRFTPGFEGIGVIERVGPRVPESVIGDRVLPIGSAGSWQQVKRIHASWCIPVPQDIPDDVACFAYINPLTALLMVQRFCTTTTRHVVVTAATSTIANPDPWAAIVDTSDPLWPDRLRAATGKDGADVVFDCAGGALGAELMEHLTPGGVLAHYGLLSSEALPRECFTHDDGRRVEMFSPARHRPQSPPRPPA